MTINAGYDAFWFKGSPCYGTGGYSDLGVGAPVTVRNGDGQIIATGSLEEGTSGGLEITDRKVPSCTMPLRVDDVPEVDFYQIEIGNRGALSYSKTDLENRGWVVGFSLGQGF